MVFGVASLLLLQIFFAVGAFFLFLSQKTEKKELDQQRTSYLSGEMSLKNEFASLLKAFERMERKFEDLKKIKVDGWQDECDDLKKKIRSESARVSGLGRMIKQITQEEPGDEDDEPNLLGFPGASTLEPQIETPASSFGRVAK